MPSAATLATRSAPTSGWKGYVFHPGMVVVLIGLGLAGAVSGVFGWRVWEEYREISARESQRAELLAQVVEDHAARMFETVDIALASLGELAAAEKRSAIPSELQRALPQALVGLPFLRSIAVVNGQGEILASTHSPDVTLAIDLSMLKSPGSTRLGGIGPWIAGRQLADLASGHTNPIPRGLGFIPYVRHLDPEPGGAVLVALINPDALGGFQQRALGMQGRVAVLTSYRGQVLASNAASLEPGAAKDGLPLPGEDVASHPVFRKLLAEREFDTYAGPGLGGEPNIGAYRASRSQSVVALVEYPELLLQGEWRRTVRPTLVAAMGALLSIVVITWLVLRIVRSRLAARAQLNAALARVVQSERELSTLVRSIQEVVFRTDAQGKLTFVNARWYAASGRNKKETLGRRLSQLVADENRKEVERLFSTTNGAGARAAEVWLPDGKRGNRRLQLVVVPLRNGDQVTGFAGSANDLTERWLAEKQLESQLRFSALLLEISPEPVYMVDAQGRYITVNKAWEDFTGYRRDDFIGKDIARTLESDEAQLHRDQDAFVLARGGTTRYEATYRHPDGSRRNLLISKVAVPADSPQGAAVLCAFVDITEFRDAERATREARDVAEEASRAKSEFVANISHELRTPLQAIIGFSELGMLRGGTAQRLMSMFSDIHASGQRMLALVNDLLDVSKLESHVGTLHLERIDLRGLVREVVRELGPLMAKRELRMSVELSDAPLVAKVDPARFQQVIRNILANAIKFSSVRQTIEICGEASSHGELHFSVRDYGPGIPDAELTAVFEAFVQSSRTKDGSGGTGLGLAICTKIVEAHGGYIEAENAAGGGARFHIWLPSRGFHDTVPAAADF